jgi:hypothetical protein
MAFLADSCQHVLDRPSSLAGRDPHDVDGVADHVAGSALAFGASGHYQRRGAAKVSMYRRASANAPPAAE